MWLSSKEPSMRWPSPSRLSGPQIRAILPGHPVRSRVVCRPAREPDLYAPPVVGARLRWRLGWTRVGASLCGGSGSSRPRGSSHVLAWPARSRLVAGRDGRRRTRSVGVARWSRPWPSTTQTVSGEDLSGHGPRTRRCPIRPITSREGSRGDTLIAREEAAVSETLQTDDQLLVTPEEAARRLSVGRTTIYELMSTGELPSVNIGRCRRVAVSSLMSFVSSLLGDCITD